MTPALEAFREIQAPDCLLPKRFNASTWMCVKQGRDFRRTRHLVSFRLPSTITPISTVVCFSYNHTLIALDFHVFCMS